MPWSSEKAVASTLRTETGTVRDKDWQEGRHHRVGLGSHSSHKMPSLTCVFNKSLLMEGVWNR